MKTAYSIKFILSAIIIAFITACGSTKESSNSTEEVNPNGNLFVISTKFGDMTIELYDETPLHRDNFKKLVADYSLEKVK